MSKFLENVTTEDHQPIAAHSNDEQIKGTYRFLNYKFRSKCQFSKTIINFTGKSQVTSYAQRLTFQQFLFFEIKQSVKIRSIYLFHCLL